MLTIVCPHCGCRLNVSEKAIGHDAECVSCHKIFTAAQPPAPPVVYPTERVNVGLPSPKEFKFSRWLGVPVFIVALIGFIVFAKRTPTTSPPDDEFLGMSLPELQIERDEVERQLASTTNRLKQMNAAFRAAGTNGDKNPEYMNEVANFYNLSHMSESLNSGIETLRERARREKVKRRRDSD